MLDCGISLFPGRKKTWKEEDLKYIEERAQQNAFEEGRRQRAEARRNNWMGIQTPSNCEHRVDGGVLDPCSLRSRAEGGASIPFCLLPSALCLS